MLHRIVLGIWIAISASFCPAQKSDTTLFSSEKLFGITSVAPPSPYQSNPFEDLRDGCCANWTCLVPYAFTPPHKPHVLYDIADKQWWGETTAGISASIHLAHEVGMSVLLKPQVWNWAQWTGEYSFETASDWQSWEGQYLQYIMHMAKIAEENEVAAFCIGTEFKVAIEERTEFWLGLIDSVRKVYNGPLTYASNWDNYSHVRFWDKLDFIGINAYFPLSKEKTASTEMLLSAWKPIVAELSEFSKLHNKQICFTEYGYMSVDHAAWRTWENESRVHELPINELAQANALEALHTAFYDENWFMGGFLWKWFPEGKGGEGYNEKDYTPQHKIAQQVIRNRFCR